MKKNRLYILAVIALFLGFSGSLSLQGQITDYDLNTYSEVVIGNQTWMGENLKVTHFRDGTSISNITASAIWISTNDPGYCWYNNNETYKNVYGVHTIV
jgi:uncharacterized protein (TIGR02145 family)